MVDFAGNRLVRFTPSASNGQVIVADGAGTVITHGLFRVHWLAGAAGPLYVERHTSDDNTARHATLHYEVTTAEKDHVIVADGSPVRVSGNAADANLVVLERVG